MTPGERGELSRFLEGWPQRKLAQAASLRELRQFATEESSTIPLPEGCAVEPIERDGVQGELLVPQGADRAAAILFHHGGGHVFGSPLEHRHFAARLAAAAGVTAYNLAYPLAPENPFPAGLDRAVANYRFVLDQGIAPERLIVAGDSAGGNLSVVMLLRLRALGLPMPIGTYLLSPWLDLATIPPDHDLARDPLLAPEAMRAWSACYRAGREATAPEISPLFATIDEFPATLIHAGGAEMLLDDALEFARKLAKSQAAVQLSVFPHMIHAWPLFHAALPLAAAAAFAQFADWVAQLLNR